MTRPRITSAHLIAFLALFVALGGTVYAASRINGKTIAKGSIPANRLKVDSVTGSQVNEDALATVPDATHAAQADRATQASKASQAESAVNAQNAKSAQRAVDAENAEDAVLAGESLVARNALELAGVQPSGWQRACQAGAIKGMARITPKPGTPDVSSAFNCSGGGIGLQAKGTGEYEVSFFGLNGAIAVATATGLHGAVSVGGTGPSFLVKVWNTSTGNLLGDEIFNILVF